MIITGFSPAFGRQTWGRATTPQSSSAVPHDSQFEIEIAQTTLKASQETVHASSDKEYPYKWACGVGRDSPKAPERGSEACGAKSDVTDPSRKLRGAGLRLSRAGA